MSNDIAIIGMSGRFPKSKTTDELWKNLINKRDLVKILGRGELTSKIEVEANKFTKTFGSR